MIGFFNRVKTYLKLSGVIPISRRYFVMNGFDGAMIILGIVIGAYISGTTDAFFIVATGLGASLAMGLSGFYGAYATEEAERIRVLNNLEKSMLKKLDKTIIAKANKFASLWVALVDALSPFLIAIIGLIPFFFSISGIISIKDAVYSSIGLILFLLFLLGVFLGRISKKNIIISGLKMLFVGLILTLISFFFKSIS